MNRLERHCFGRLRRGGVRRRPMSPSSCRRPGHPDERRQSARAKSPEQGRGDRTQARRGVWD
ncbi:MAG: hypothetical protein EBZ36_03370 [Acidobacteria bacterium]|nr:hypothetical protein [Acidobacteriota bacterium]